MSFGRKNADETRVMSLVFDNSDFESNAKQSISTIDKLKKALNASTKVKIFEDINNGARSVTVQPILDGLDEVTAKFSTITSMTDQWKRRIADNIYDAVTGVIKDSTIGQLTKGWEKYEEKTQSVQTIMAATKKDWADERMQMNYVNEQLDKLNWYSDETSASLNDMTDNIGKFISNGISIDKATTSLIGVSNWAYISGANIQQAARAMYNLSQSMGTGAVKLQDWMSIENAQMATMDFKKTVLETGVELGLLKKKADGVYEDIKTETEITAASFRDELKKGWFTSELLVGTLEKYGAFTEAIYNTQERLGHGLTTTSLLRYLDAYMDGTMTAAQIAKELGVTVKSVEVELDYLSKDEFALGRASLQAAQEAKTLTEALDSVKDAASTAWMNVYETLFGDYLEQKGFWTDAANALYDAFVEPVNSLQSAVQGAFSKTSIIGSGEWQMLKDAGYVTDEMIDDIIKAGKKFGDITDEMVVDASNFTNSLDDEQWFTVDLFNRMFTFKDGTDKITKSTINATKSLKNLTDVGKKLKERVPQDLVKNVFSLSNDKRLEFSKNVEEGIDDIRRIRKMAEELRSDPEIGLDPNGWAGFFQEANYKESAYQKYIEILKEEFGKLRDEEGDTATITDKLLDDVDRLYLKAVGLADGTAEGTKKYLDDLNAVDEAAVSVAKNGADIIKWVHKTDNEGHMEYLPADLEMADYWGEILNDTLFTLAKLVETVFDEFTNTFGGVSENRVQNIVLKIYDLVEQFKHFVLTSTDLRAVLDAVFSIFAIKTKLIHGALKGILGVFSAIVDGFSRNAPEGESAIQRISNLIVRFNRWLSESNVLGEAFGFIADIVRMAASAVRDWIDSIKIGGDETESFTTRIYNGIRTAFGSLGDFFKGLRERLVQFKESVQSLDKISLKGIYEALKSTFGDYIINFEGFQPIKDAFHDLWTYIKDSARGIGIDIDGILQILSYFGSYGSKGFSWLIDKALGFGDALTKIGNSTFFQINTSRFKGAFVDFFENLGPWLSKVSKKWDEFKAKVKDIGGFKLSNLGTIFAEFFGSVGKEIMSFDGFKSFGYAFKGLFKDLGVNIKDDLGIDIPGFIGEVVNTFDTIRKKIADSGILETVAKIFEDIVGIVSRAVSNISGSTDGATLGDKLWAAWERIKWVAGIVYDAFEVIKNAVGGAVSWVMDKLQGVEIPKPISDLINKIKPEATEKISASIENVGNSIEVLTGEIKDANTIGGSPIPKWLSQLKDEILGVTYAFIALKIVGNIRAIFDRLGSVRDAMANFYNKTAMLKMAASIGVLAGCVFALAQIPLEQIVYGALITSALAGLMVGIFKLFSKVEKQSGVFGADVVVSMLSIALAIGVLAGIMWLMRDFFADGNSILPGMAAIGVSIGAIWGIMMLMKLVGKSAADASKSALSVALAIGILGVVALMLGNTKDWMWLAKGAAFIAVALGLLIAAFAIMKKAGTSATDAAKGFRDVGIALLALAAALVIMQFINPAKAGNIAVGFVGVLGAFWVICKVLKKNDAILKEGGKAVKDLAILIGVLVGSVILLGLMPIGILEKGGVAVVLIAAVIAGLMFAIAAANKIAGGLDKAWKTIIALTALIAAAGVMLTVMVAVNPNGGDQYLKTAQALALVFVSLAAVMAVITALSKYSEEGSMKRVWSSLAAALVGMAGVAAIMFGIVKLLDKDEIERFGPAADALLIAVVALAACMAAITLVSKIAGANLNIAGMFLSLVVALSAFAGVALVLGVLVHLLDDREIDNLIPAVEALALGLGALIAAAALMGALGLMAPLIAVGAGVILLISGVIVLIGALMGSLAQQDFDTLIADMEKCGEFLESIGKAIGNFFGGIIAGAMETYAESLTEMDDLLSDFAETMRDVDADAIEKGVESLKRISKAMTSIAWDTFWTDLGLTFFIDNGGIKGNVNTFKENANTLADALIEFGEKMYEVGDIEIPVQAITDLSEAIKNLPFSREGFLSIFTGKDAPTKEDVDEFKEIGVLMAGAIKEFNDALPENMDLEKVNAAGQVLAALGQLTQTAFQMYQSGMSMNELLEGSDRGGGLMTAALTVARIIQKVSEYDYDLDKLDGVKTAIDAITEVFDILSEVQIPGGTDLMKTNRVDRMFNSLARIIEGINGLTAGDTTAAYSLTRAINKINTISLTGDLADRQKVKDWKDSAKDLSKVYAEIADEAVKSAKKIAKDENNDGGIIGSLFGDLSSVKDAGEIIEKLKSGDFAGLIGENFDISSLLGGADINTLVGSFLGGENGLDLTSLLSNAIGGADGKVDVAGSLLSALGGEGSVNTSDLLGSLMDTSALTAEGGVGTAGIFAAMLGSNGGDIDATSDLVNYLGGENSVDAAGLIDSLIDTDSLGEDGTYNLPVTLVYDTESLKAQFDSMMNQITEDGVKLSPQMEGLVEAKIDLTPLESAIGTLRSDTVSNLQTMQYIMNEVSNRLGSLASAMDSMQLVLDTGTLVGQITPQIDRSLGGAYGRSYGYGGY